MNITEKQELIINSQKAIVRLKGCIEQEVLKGSGESWDAKFYGRLIKAHEEKIALLENNAPNVASNRLQYKEVEINGEIFLECTSCSADKGNCSCWSC